MYMTFVDNFVYSSEVHKELLVIDIAHWLHVDVFPVTFLSDSFCSIFEDERYLIFVFWEK